MAQPLTSSAPWRPGPTSRLQIHSFPSSVSFIRGTATMARPSATHVLLLLSLLAVAHCRTLESDPAATSETETVASATEIVPAGFLRLPSHRRHHGVFGDGHRFHRHGDAEVARDGEASRREGVAEEEVKAVAEPDPDRTRPDSDDSAVKRWRKEALWRMFRHEPHHHHHEDDDDEEEEDHEQEGEDTAGVKRFRRDEDEDEEKEHKMRKLFHPHADGESDEEELEEVVRRFRKAIMRRRFGFHHLHGRFFRQHHHGRHHQHHHAEHEGGGVVTWIRGLMNRF